MFVSECFLNTNLYFLHTLILLLAFEFTSFLVLLCCAGSGSVYSGHEKPTWPVPQGGDAVFIGPLQVQRQPVQQGKLGRSYLFNTGCCVVRTI